LRGQSIERAQVVLTTLAGAESSLLADRKFPVAIIDEGSQGLELLELVGITKAQRLILAGDHFQLDPTVLSDRAAKAGLGNSLFGKIIRRHPEAKTKLTEQYRMHRDIMSFSNEYFYEGELTAHAGVADRQLNDGQKPVVFLDTAGAGYEDYKNPKTLSSG